MDTIKKADRFLSGLEWKWSLATLAWGIPTAIASFALPAWAVGATKIFEAYAPISWVLAGFCGSAFAATIYSIAAWGRGKWVRSRYDARMLAQGGAVDPLEKTFERKRIYLNEFCLPSHPLVENKSFIDCEIIGPGNIIFVSNNSINQGKYPICDAVWLKEDAIPSGNYFLVSECVFRGCNFTRITFFVPNHETEMFRNYSLVKWITSSPYDETDDAVPVVTDEARIAQLIAGDEAPNPPPPPPAPRAA